MNGQSAWEVMVEQSRSMGSCPMIVRFCTYDGWDRLNLKKQVEQRGIPILDIDLEYGHPAGAQVKLRAEAFMETLESRASSPGSSRHAMRRFRDGHQVCPGDRVWL